MNHKHRKKKDAMLRVRLEAQQQRDFEALMQRKGECMSSYVRRLIVDAIQQDNKTAMAA
jgi:hypothetical protein